MPENKTIHDLPIAEQTNASDVFETEIPSQLMQSGYASRKVTMSSLETHMLGTEQYETQLPNFPQGSRSVFSALEYARQSGGGGASVVQKTMAEYTALPTSEKMNGSIYKITDKALIYCLDEEYHALKEITSADYAQLTPAEQNNGTIYVKTDEETTAADIPYDNTVSGLTADDIQEAVDEVADKLDDAIKVVTFTGDTSLTVTAGGVLSVKASDFDYAIPNGYTPIALSTYRFPQTNDFLLVGVDLSATGSTQFGVARNVANSNKTSTLTVIVAFARNDLM